MFEPTSWRSHWICTQQQKKIKIKKERKKEKRTQLANDKQCADRWLSIDILSTKKNELKITFCHQASSGRTGIFLWQDRSTVLLRRLYISLVGMWRRANLTHTIPSLICDQAIYFVLPRTHILHLRMDGAAHEQNRHSPPSPIVIQTCGRVPRKILVLIYGDKQMAHTTQCMRINFFYYYSPAMHSQLNLLMNYAPVPVETRIGAQTENV